MDGSVPNEIREPLAMSVGLLVVNWAFVEAVLNAWCTLAYQAPGGGQITRDLPRGFSRKVRFLKQCLRDLPPLAPFAEEARATLNELKRISKVRDFVVHGAITNYDEEGRILRFTKVDTTDEHTMHQLNSLTIPADELLKCGFECEAMLRPMHKLTHRMIDLLAH